MNATIEHYASSLNSSLIGGIEDGVVCFRGIPYASLDKRWTHSRTKHALESPFDATKYGPRCPQGDGLVLVTGGVNDPTPGDDEFDCLNLNIAVPENALKNSILPVMVWIHGGAFNYGANSVARYRPVELCLLAKSNENPVIVVQIQYRLGPLGFAAGNDLHSEHHPLSSSTFPATVDPNSTFGNFGFVDQIHALEWVRDHIEDFGGDPRNVTAFGVSAGSASIHHHILTGAPLFDRAILMSGSAPTLGPLPIKLYETAWESFVARSNCFGDKKTSEERLEKARCLEPAELIRSYPSAAMGPMADGALLPRSWSYNDAQKPTRCKSIIIGDTKVEAIIMDGLINSISQQDLPRLINSSIDEGEALLHAFGIGPDMPEEAYRDAMRSLLSVGMFQYPNILVANTFPGKVYFYHFDEPSPYPGPTFGLPYHGQCALFLYQNGKSEYPCPARNTAESMGKMWTAFASGKVEPWEDYQEANRFIRLGPNGESSLQSWKSDNVREYKWLSWVNDHYESLKKVTRDLTLRV